MRSGTTARSWSRSTANAPARGGQLPALDEHLQHDRGGGERQPSAEDEGRRALEAHQPEQAPDDQGRREDLRDPESEDVVPERDQAPRRERQADGEEEENDAELAQDARGLDLTDEAESVGADQRAGDQIPEHRAGAESTEQRHDGCRGEQDDQQVFEIDGIDHCAVSRGPRTGSWRGVR